MLSFNPEKINCSGCAACYSICPKHCISMQRDEEGFDYPVITSPEECIDCNLCEKVCPINNEIKVSSEQRAFAALSKSYSIWHRSASGGAFSEICRAWGDDKTLVVGAAWNGLYVHHIGVIGVENIKPLCNSKYVSSHIEETFKEIKAYLKTGKVIFCGTPCQVSGLRSFLRKDYDNLLTIDFICHGVGSPSVFETCTKLIGKQAGHDLKSYSFRVKRKNHELDYLTLLTFETGREYVVDDQYIQLFFKQLCLRPSCGQNCKYRGKDRRPGDFTVADFKGLTNIFPDLKGTKRNYSSIITNSTKANKIMPYIEKNMFCRAVSIDDIVRYNPLFDHHTWFSKERNNFFNEFVNSPEATIQKWTRPYTVYSYTLKRKLFDSSPVFLRKIVLNILTWFSR